MANIDVIQGTEIKLNLHIDPIGDNHMGGTDGYDWKCEVYTSSESKTIIEKDSNLALNDEVLTGPDDTILLVDTSLLEPGTIKIKVIAYIPDDDFAYEGNDGLRTEIQIVNTNIKIK